MCFFLIQSEFRSVLIAKKIVGTIKLRSIWNETGNQFPRLYQKLPPKCNGKPVYTQKYELHCSEKWKGALDGTKCYGRNIYKRRRRGRSSSLVAWRRPGRVCVYGGRAQRFWIALTFTEKTIFPFKLHGIWTSWQFFFHFELNRFPFGSKSKSKPSSRSYPIQFEWKYSFLIVNLSLCTIFRFFFGTKQTSVSFQISG